MGRTDDNNLDLEVPCIDETSDIIFTDADSVIIRKGLDIIKISEINKDDFVAFIQTIDGVRSVAEICLNARNSFGSDRAREIISQLSGTLLFFRTPLVPPSESKTRIAIVGRSSVANMMFSKMNSSSLFEGKLYSFKTSDIQSQTQGILKEEIALFGHEHEDLQYQQGIETTLGELAATNKLIIAVSEGDSFQAMLELNEACAQVGTPCIFVTVDHKHIIIGPSVIGGKTSCLECALRVMYDVNSIPFATIQSTKTSGLMLNSNTIDMLTQVTNNVFEEAKALVDLESNGKFQYIETVELVLGNEKKKSIKVPIPKAECCSVCFKESARQSSDMGGSPIHTRDISLALKQLREYSLLQSKDRDRRETLHADESVGILGGGTAGYLTALALKKKYPALKVTLIESSKIPIIGVGEATTPLINHFLFEQLGFDSLDFYKKVQPTWKLGIKFFWGLPGDYYFNYPFGSTDLWSACSLSNNINECSLTSMLMSSDSSFVLELDKASNRYFSLSKDILYAFHLDNKRFVDYLKQKAELAGINYIDRSVVHCEISENGEDIRSVICDDNSTLSFDLYVDCSGFRSILLEGALKSKFVDYKSSLFTDTAIAANVPHDGFVKPYTLAETMKHGWNWSIPMRDEDHRGYVFSSSFCSVDEAAKEMYAGNPRMGDYRVIKFRSGRHEHFWKGNVVGIGNSYGFVEPLESTGIHMILFEIQVLIDNFPSYKSKAIQKYINAHVNERWDYLRWFLAMHYKFNRKLNTPFWKECQANANISGMEELLALYKENGLLSQNNPRTQELLKRSMHDNLFGFNGVDNLLLGQGIFPDKMPRQVDHLQKKKWELNVSKWKELVKLAVPLKRDLEILLQQPNLI